MTTQHIKSPTIPERNSSMKVIGAAIAVVGAIAMWASYLVGVIGFFACLAAVVGIGDVELNTGLTILGFAVGAFVASLLIGGLGAMAVSSNDRAF